MKPLDLGDAEAPKRYFVTTMNFNGKEQETILVFADCPIKRKNLGRNETYEPIDKGKLLSTLVCLCDAKPLYIENVPLYDYVGSKTKNLPNNAPTVMIYLDRADNVNLLGLTDGPLQAELVECDSVVDAYRRVATTVYFSQYLSKDKWIGCAGIVAGGELLLDTRGFGEKYSISGTTVQGYSGISATISLLQSKALAMSSSLFKEEYRTHAQAGRLMKATVQAFGVRAAKQARYTKAINYGIPECGFDTVCGMLNSIEAIEKLWIEAARCEGKISCIQRLIIERVIEMRNAQRR